jgi:hypothetical protein
MQKIDEFVSVMRVLGTQFKESKVVKKVLRSLLEYYSEKISSIEEVVNIDHYSRDHIDTLCSFEMRKNELKNGINCKEVKVVE